MDQYPIPQFIEQDSKIAVFLSFKQFFYLCGAGVVVFVAYYTLPFFFFIVVSFAAVGAAVALGFLTFNGQPLPVILMSSIGFLTGSKNYTWKKKESLYPFKAIKRIQIRKLDDGPILKAQQSMLKRIHTQVETKTK